MSDKADRWEHKLRILIWGTGENTRKYLDTKEIRADEIIGFVESRPVLPEFEPESYGKYNIYAPKDIEALTYDFLLICVWHREAVKLWKPVSNSIYWTIAPY